MVMPSTRTGFYKDIYFSSFMIVDSELPLCGIFSIDELCDYRVGGGSSGGNEKGDEHSIEQVPSFTKAYAACKTVKTFLYMHSISEHDSRMFRAWNWCGFV